MSFSTIVHDGQELRRDSAYEAGNTALLFVDMRRIWIEPHTDPYGRPVDGYYHTRVAEVVVPNQVRILTAARGRGVNVLHTIIQSLTNDGRDRSLDHKLSGIHVPCDSQLGNVIDELSPTLNEITL